MADYGSDQRNDGGVVSSGFEIGSNDLGMGADNSSPPPYYDPSVAQSGFRVQTSTTQTSFDPSTGSNTTIISPNYGLPYPTETIQKPSYATGYASSNYAVYGHNNPGYPSPSGQQQHYHSQTPYYPQQYTSYGGTLNTNGGLPPPQYAPPPLPPAQPYSHQSGGNFCSDRRNRRMTIIGIIIALLIVFCILQIIITNHV